MPTTEPQNVALDNNIVVRRIYMKLNGWQRLWILLSTTYFIFVTSYVILEFPQAEDIPHQSKFYEKLSKKSAGMIWPATHEDALALGVEISDLYREAVGSVLPDYVLKAFSWEDYQKAIRNRNLEAGGDNHIDFYPTIEMPNKHTIQFKNKSSKDDMNAASKEYWLGVEEKTTEKKMHFLVNAFLSWIIPCILLYVAGCGIHWVYKGFRKNPKTRQKHDIK